MNGLRTSVTNWVSSIAIAIIVASAAMTGGIARATAAPTITSPPEPERIVGGLEVNPPGRYPFVVALVNVANNQFCAGSLIAASWVLTAAHCVTDNNGVQDVFPAQVDAIVGRHDLTTATGEQLDVTTIVVHPDWPTSGNYNFLDDDVALLELATPTTLGGVIELAEPPDVALWTEPATGTVIGWGSTAPSFPYNNSDTLMEVLVPFRADAVCATAWGSPPSYTPATDVCAGGVAGEDSCVGDSGGPLIGPAGSGPWKLIGIVSGGAPICGTPNVPAVYTEVAAYLPWIQATIGIDMTPPSVTIDQAVAQSDPTADASIKFTVVFSESVSGFETGDVTVSGSANATSAVVTGSGSTYDVAVSGMTNEGIVVVGIAVGVAADASGNTNLASTSIDNRVTSDRLPPVITTPATLTVANDPGANGAVVTYEVTATDGGVTTGLLTTPNGLVAAGGLTCAPASGAVFPIGTTIVSCAATDLLANSSTATFTVIVADNEAPRLLDPGTVRATISADPTGPLVYPLPASSDNSGSSNVVCTPPPGTIVGVGTTTVTCIATDSAGNSAAVSFDVIVTAAVLPATGRTVFGLAQATWMLVAGLALLGISRTGRQRRAAWSPPA